MKVNFLPLLVLLSLFSLFLRSSGQCQADFLVDPVACPTIFFVDQSSGAINSWSWDFGDGNSSIMSNPTHVYARNGHYNVCLSVQDTGGCASTYCDSLLIACASVPITREQAVEFVLDTASGLTIDSFSTVWCPYQDYGFGASFEGMLPPGTILREEVVYTDSIILSDTAYFFWIDDMTNADFAHPVRFVTVDANNPSPTVSNGGISVTNYNWWPEVELPNGNTFTHFSTYQSRISDQTGSYTNSEGYIVGPVVTTSDTVNLPLVALDAVKNTKRCALIIRGAGDDTHKNNVERFKEDLQEVNCVSGACIIVKNERAQAACSWADFCNGVDQLVTMAKNKGCDTIFIRMTSHGTATGNFLFGGDRKTGAEICTKLKDVAKLGKPICLVINACYSGALLDDNNWNFPAGSTIITSADKDSKSWADTFTDEDGNEITESLFTNAFSRCLRDPESDDDKENGVSHKEAFKWIIEEDPPYIWPENGREYFATRGNPIIRTVGDNPRLLNLNVQNNIANNKTDFHMEFKGNVEGGAILAWASNAKDEVDYNQPWANGPGQTSSSYDNATDRTTVTWADPQDPVPLGDYKHFGYLPPATAPGLQPLRQWWTPTPAPPADQDKVPGSDQSMHSSLDNDTIIIRTGTRDTANGGWGEPVIQELYYMASDSMIPLDSLNLANNMVTSLDRYFLGSFTLNPEEPVEMRILNPYNLRLGQFLVLESHSSWSLNSSEQTLLVQFAALVYKVLVCKALFDYLSKPGLQVDFSHVSSIPPRDTLSSVLWDFGDGNSSTSLNPSHQYSQPGLYEVCLTVFTEDSCSSQYCDSINAIMGAIGQDIMHTSLTIYPNPARERFTVDYELNSASTVMAKLIGMDGREYISVDLGAQAPGKQSFSLGTTMFPAGTYIVKVQTDHNQVFSDQIIILKE